MTDHQALRVLGFSGEVCVRQSEVKRKFRELSKVLHPDLATGDEARFMELRLAYGVAQSIPEGFRVSLTALVCSIEQGSGVFSYVVDGLSYSF